MIPQEQVIMWLTRESYGRFVELCDDEVPKTFDDFERKANAFLSAQAEHGIFFKKVIIDPDKLALWCKDNHRRVDTQARAHYVTVLARDS